MLVFFFAGSANMEIRQIFKYSNKSFQVFFTIQSFTCMLDKRDHQLQKI